LLDEPIKPTHANPLVQIDVPVGEETRV
jgi:hypothetical protein